ncbi:MAG: hypothetical protein QM698_03780 [Micropepsaceae bacterium]
MRPRLQILALAVATIALGGCTTTILSTCRPPINAELRDDGVIAYDGLLYTIEAFGPNLAKSYKGNKDCYVGVKATPAARDAWGIILAQALASSGFKKTKVADKEFYEDLY